MYTFLGFEILTGIATDNYSTISPPWYGEWTFPQNGNGIIEVTIETLAINLLSAELQMRTCERQVFACDTFFDKGHSVRMMLPYLLEYASSISGQKVATHLQKLITKLQVRTHWLVGTFYVWWSRNTQKLNDKKEAE